MIKRVALLFSLIVLVFGTALFITLATPLGGLGLDVRLLGKLYLYFTAHENPELTTASREPVAAIVWDFRGLDTFFETTVFVMAVIAAYSMFLFSFKSEERAPGDSFTVIPRLITKLLLPINIAVASSIALHGSTSPGGGFQAGSALAVIGVLSATVFSYISLNSPRINAKTTLALMCIGLLGIAAIGFYPVLIGYLSANSYFMQNQPKPDSSFGYPGEVLGYAFGGSIGFLNMAEFLTISFGFLTIFSLLSLPERVLKEKEEAEEVGEF